MSAPRRHRCEPGFVLVGVVIIVLALTILGLSLFSLSNYEAQFMQRSLDRQQTLQSALGGLDRARYALIAKNQTLAQVRALSPSDSVFYTRATQLQGAVVDSASAVVWGGNDIHIESAATVGGVTRWAEAWYVPHQSVNYYSRLMTLSASVSGTIVFPGFLLPIMSDTIRQASNDVSWLATTPPLLFMPPVQRNQPVPVPSASAFIAAHLGAPEPQIFNGDYILNAPQGGPPAYFCLNKHPGSTVLSYYDQQDLPQGGHTIRVNGRAILCVPHGIRWDGHVDIVSNGDPNACLVIVAGEGHDYIGTARPDNWGAIWFFSGVQSSIPTILVSDAMVKIEGSGQTNSIISMQNLSVFANQVFLKGSTGATAQFSLGYGNPVTMQAQLDFLFSFGALPNSASPNSTQLSLRPGTWRVTQ